MNVRNVAFPDKEKIAEFCRHRHIRRLALFGSVLRDDFGPESDIDILVEFERGHVPGFFGLFKLEREFSLLFGVWKVDLRTPEDLSRYFRNEAQAVVQYARE
ncbi:MAG: nucleotidyltransferase [Acidobacteria bacterium]|nr:MAG: nucleotidyltransferase [Acidobacteriota bacterium]